MMRAALICACLLGAAATAHASGPGSSREPGDGGAPGRFGDWITTVSEHFVLTHHEGLDETADRAIRLAERAHARLSKLLGWNPRERTYIVLVDDVDFANGFANVFARNRIFLIATPPEQQSVLNDYDDWLNILVSHEHTHILHLDNKRGLPVYLNAVLGKWFNPNQINPRWLTEGLAVYEESSVSGGGRIRSSLFDMYMRTDAIQGRWMTVDQIAAGSISRWPGATAWYSYGGHFFQYLADRFGEERFAVLSELYGERLVPYGLNTTAEDAFGADWVRIYDDFTAFSAAKYEIQLRPVRARPITQSEAVTARGWVHEDPLYLPAAPGEARPDIVYHRSVATEESGWVRYNAQTDTHTLFVRTGGYGGGALSRDGLELIYSQSVQYGPWLPHFDLFSYRFDTKQSERLTVNARARDPAVSPDARRIAYCAVRRGKTTLRVLNRADGADEPIAFGEGAPDFDQVFSPAFSPDGRFLVFAAARTGAYRDLWAYDFDTRALHRLTDDEAVELQPQFHHDAPRLLFSADRGGIYNVFEIDLSRLGGDDQPGPAGRLPDARFRRLTNVETGAFDPFPSADGTRIAFVRYGWEGFDVHTMAYPLDGIPAPAPTAVRTPVDPEPPPVNVEREPYSPFPTLWPLTWMPVLGTDAKGTTIGVRTNGSDIIGRHFWSATAAYGLDSRDPTIALGYSNFATPVGIGTFANHASYTLPRAGRIGTRDVDVDQANYSAGISTAFTFGDPIRAAPRRDYRHGISLSYNVGYARNLSAYTYSPLDTRVALPRPGLSAGLSLTWFFGNQVFSPQSIGAIAGQGMYVSVTVRDRALGSDFRSIFLNFGGSHYFKIPGTRTHTLAFNLNGGTGWTGGGGTRLFFLGGPAERNLISDVLNQERQFGNFLRGYKPFRFSGDSFWLLNAEYRFEIWSFDRGGETYPIFLRRLHAAVFYDMGNAFVGTPRLDAQKSLGAEVRAEMTMGWFSVVQYRLGFAYGLDPGGAPTVYLALDNIF